jgi:hypothetical protein
MANTLFDIAAEKLEGSAGLDRLAARGTLRIALKEAGLDAQSLTVPHLRAVFEKLMPKELEARGVADATATCNRVMSEVESAANSADLEESSSPEEIFKRLGGS